MENLQAPTNDDILPLATRVKNAIAKSTQLYRSKEYDESLESAEVASSMASSEKPGSPAHLEALMHLGSIYGAMRMHQEALAALDELLTLTEEAHDDESVELLPVLHAKAEVLEAMQAPLAGPAEQLRRARDIRRRAFGAESMDAAKASFNLATLLMRGAHDEDVAMTNAKRAELVVKALELSREACTIAKALGEDDLFADFASALLELLGPDDSDAASELRATMLDAYREATGEEWEGEDVEGMMLVTGHGLEDFPFPSADDVAPNWTLEDLPASVHKQIPAVVDAVIVSRTTACSSSASSSPSGASGGGHLLDCGEEPDLESLSDAVTSVASEVLEKLHQLVAAAEGGGGPMAGLTTTIAPEMASWATIETGLGSEGLIQAMVLAHSLRPSNLHRVRVAPSAHGDGVFASGPIAKGELVTMYPCEALLIRKETDAHGPQEANGQSYVRARHPECPISQPEIDELMRYTAMVLHTPLSVAADPEQVAPVEACGHLINDAAALLGADEPTDEEVDEYIKASVAGCNVVLHPICGCALGVVAITDIADGEELLTSYGVRAWEIHAEILAEQE